MSVQFKNASHGSPSIVTSGLILYLDAANNVSYVSGSTTWNDMSGFNNSMSNISNPSYTYKYGGGIVYNYIFCCNSRINI
jgi:hypothetical protein